MFSDMTSDRGGSAGSSTGGHPGLRTAARPPDPDTVPYGVRVRPPV